MKMMYTTQTREGSGVYNLRVSSGEGEGGERGRKRRKREERERWRKRGGGRKLTSKWVS